MKDEKSLTELLEERKEDLTVRELYELLKPLIDEYGDFEIRVSYDSETVFTPIKDKLPLVEIGRKLVKLWGY